MRGLSFRLYRAELVYPAGQEVHTAASGRIQALDELFLDIVDAATGIVGQGEVRTNIEFITGTPGAEVAPGVIGLLERCQPIHSIEDFVAYFAEHRHTAPRISQALVENALCDFEARRQGVSLCTYLGGLWRDGVSCNQCVFWGSDEDMRRNLALYWKAGFRKIKLRVAVGSVAEDESRLAWIRKCYGDDIELSIDANGGWNVEVALAALDRLRHYGISYVEQPTCAGKWEWLERVALESGVPVMIDEGLQTTDDVERLCALNGLVSAHLKIAKAGGVASLVAIGRALDQHNVNYVVGQMNEGGLATAIATHAAMALHPLFGELYGAMGIVNDSTLGVTYDRGKVIVLDGPGVGVHANHTKSQPVWSSRPI